MKFERIYARPLKSARRFVLENIMDLDHVCVVHRRWFGKLRIVEWKADWVDYRLESRFFGLKQHIVVRGATIDANSYWYEFNGRLAQIRVDGTMEGPDGALLLTEKITYRFHWSLTPLFWLLGPLFQRQKEDILRDDTALLERVYELDMSGFRRSVDIMRPKIVVYGGSGFFGRLVVADLLEHTGANIVVASRNPTFVDFSPHENRVQFYFSDTNDLESIRRILDGATVAICAIGPFQRMSLNVLKGCIERKVHYIDVADDRDFVVRAYGLKAEIERAGISALIGCSVVPGISSLLTQYCLQWMARAERVRISITPGTRLTRGPGSFECLLSTVGRSYSIPSEGTQREICGWSEREQVDFPPPVGRRYVYHVVDIADYYTQPLYFGTRTVSFKIGAELDFLNRSLSAFRYFKRLVSGHNDRNWIPFFRPFISMASPFGTTQGAMMVEVFDGTESMSMSVAKADHGETIPAALPTIAVQRLLSGSLQFRGIVPLPDWIPLDVFRKEMARRGVQLFLRSAGQHSWSLSLDQNDGSITKAR